METNATTAVIIFPLPVTIYASVASIVFIILGITGASHPITSPSSLCGQMALMPHPVFLWFQSRLFQSAASNRRARYLHRDYNESKAKEESEGTSEEDRTKVHAS